mmetsp:Transcript_68431/g.164303  ORF Transcript_68431/g.164303 Transcript_68431/m.164303 type:complete len:662 (+) Transcript_68431:127-2112(+)
MVLRFSDPDLTNNEDENPSSDGPDAIHERYERAYCRLPHDPLPFFPPGDLEFDMFFFRKLFDRLEAGNLTVRGKVHVTVLRSMSVKLLDAMGLDGLSAVENDFFGLNPKNEKVWFTWVDLCKNLNKVGHPVVKLKAAERIFMTLDMAESSALAQLFMVLMMGIILANLVLSVIQTLPNYECPSVLIHSSGSDECGRMIQSYCMFFFSIEYIVKLVCSPFVRVELFDREALMETIAHSHRHRLWDRPALGPIARVWFFVSNPMNLIDMISILPMWISLVVGEFLPASSASFLRVLRVGRVFRILKTGRYLEMLQILATVISRSMRSILVLMIFVVIVVLLAGVLLEQVEPGDTFSTVPLASYWIGAHLINMKPVPGYTNPVRTAAGVTILTVVMILKAVLWILPVGQMKGAYDDACRSSEKMKEMKDEVRYEMTRPEWVACAGLTDSAQAYLEFSELRSRGVIAVASLPVPILCRQHKDFEVTVPVLPGSLSVLGGCCSTVLQKQSPTMTMQVRWRPSPIMIKSAKPSLPHGRLTVRPLKITGLSIAGMSCYMYAPTGLGGRGMAEACTCLRLTAPLEENAADGPPLEGEWEFDIDWRLSDPPKEGKVNGHRPSCDKATLKRVYDDIDDQTEVLKAQAAAIQDQVKQLEVLKTRLQALTVEE